METDICNFIGTSIQLINLVIGQDNTVCGGTPIEPVQEEATKEIAPE